MAAVAPLRPLGRATLEGYLREKSKKSKEGKGALASS